MNDDVIFFQRTFPSANMVLLTGKKPVLVDSGFGGDVRDTVELLKNAGCAPESLQMIVNTHYHGDHAGGNHTLQSDYGLTIAAHRWEAHLINQRDRDACASEWLGQAVEPYTVNLPLSDGDVISTGDREWRVIHTQGHTLGHISLYSDGVLIGGDLVHDDDIAWMNPYREGVGSIYRALESLERLTHLPLEKIYCGHGAAITDPARRIEEARQRYEKWLAHPHKVAWHAMKRIFSYALMLEDGMQEDDILHFLLYSPWYIDYCRYTLSVDPAEFLPDFIDELLRSGAAKWQDKTLVAGAPYNPPDRVWLLSIPRPADW